MGIGTDTAANAVAAPREVRAMTGQPSITAPLSIPYLRKMPENPKAGHEVAHKQFRLPPTWPGSHTSSAIGAAC